MTEDKATAAEFVNAVPKILARYAKIVAANPGMFCDEKLLPCSKPVMKAVLKIGWELARTDEQRDWIGRGWSLLSTFQPGVGDKPIGKAPPDATVDQLTAHAELVARFSQAALEEMERDEAELSAYFAKGGR